MLKCHVSFSNKVILLITLAYFMLLLRFTETANQRENTSGEDDQFKDSSSSTSIENQAAPSRSIKKRRHQRADRPKYLSLTVSSSKINMIEQKENEMKIIYSQSAVSPWQPGHYWNLSELSDPEAVNLCYSLWLGLRFSEIDGIDKTNLPSQLYAYCVKAKKFPLKDINNSGPSNFYYYITYPSTDSSTHRHRIGVMQCSCRFTSVPSKRLVSSNSNRSFFAHKFRNNQYLILSPISVEKSRQKLLRIIDVLEVGPDAVDLGYKNIIPISADQSSSTSNENKSKPSGSKTAAKHHRADQPKFLSLNIPRSKINLIIQKENQLNNNYDDSTTFPRQPGHHWNLSELSDSQATNVCYSLWLGLRFSAIDETDKTDLPPHLFPYCKSKKVPIGDINDSGTSTFCHNIVYPYTDITFKSRPQLISVLQCFCRFTRKPSTRFISNDSNRKFFAYKFQENEYFILCPASNENYKHKNLKIIDVQEVDPAFVYFGDKRSTPTFTN